jgi:hypothetical protein
MANRRWPARSLNRRIRTLASAEKSHLTTFSYVPDRTRQLAFQNSRIAWKALVDSGNFCPRAQRPTPALRFTPSAKHVRRVLILFIWPSCPRFGVSLFPTTRCQRGCAQRANVFSKNSGIRRARGAGKIASPWTASMILLTAPD